MGINRASLFYTLYSGLMLLARLRPQREDLLASARAGLSVLD